MYDYVNGEGLAAAAAEIKSRIGSGSASAGGLQIEKYVDEQVNGCVSVSALPYNFYSGSAVVYNDEIHILGGSSGGTNHYAFNGTSWRKVSTLPYEFYNGSAVVYNDEIHILGGSSGGTNHYAFNGTSWRKVSTLPYEFYNGSAVVFNNKIYIIGSSESSSNRSYYNYDGSRWNRQYYSLPIDYAATRCSAVVYNDKIHVLGGSDTKSRTTHLYTNGEYQGDWGSVSTLPYEFYNGSAVVYNDEIHILGGSSGGTNHYAFNGTSWRKLYGIPSQSGGSAVIYNGEIHLLCGSHYTVKNDNRHIATMLPKGTHIMLSDNEDINYLSNATKVSTNIAEVTETGYVEVLAALPEPENIKGYLTFY